MEKKGEILSRSMRKRNRQIWCARIRGVSHVTPLLDKARNAAVMAAVTSNASDAAAVKMLSRQA
jgi:hypothetical protein